MSPDGKGITGVYSLAPGVPIKVGNFETVYQSFEDKTTYADWIFTSIPPQLNVPAGKVTLPNGTQASSNPTGNPGNTSGVAPGVPGISPAVPGSQPSTSP
jgi:hypothetical protein